MLGRLRSLSRLNHPKQKGSCAAHIEYRVNFRFQVHCHHGLGTWACCLPHTSDSQGEWGRRLRDAAVWNAYCSIISPKQTPRKASSQWAFFDYKLRTNKVGLPLQNTARGQQHGLVERGAYCQAWDLGLIPRTQMIEEKTNSYRLSSDHVYPPCPKNECDFFKF